MSNNRFDYVKYDDKAKSCQAFFKLAFMGIEDAIQRELKSPRSKALALTKMEESYMWIGKAIRDDQLERNEPSEHSKIPMPSSGSPLRGR